MNDEKLLMELPEYQARTSITFVDEAEKAKYMAWLAGVSRAVKTYVHWDLSFHEADVQYYDGNGQRNLPLRTPFVWANDTLAVYLDMTGAYGFGPTPFASTTLQTIGTAYAPHIEMRRDLDGTVTPLSKSAVLVRLPTANNQLWFPSDLAFRNPARPGGLVWNQGPFWPPGAGNIKVVCDYGFKAVPEDVKLAVTNFVQLIRVMNQNGFPVTSESLGDYSYSGALGQWQEMGTVRQLLSGYRDVAL